jgi:glycosyltransferase involved in cell wall biosynthesis
MSRDLKASVIIPTHDRKQILEKVLSYYGAQTAREDQFEVVVINDGGSDDTQSMFASFTKIDPDEKKAFSKGQKRRIEAALQGNLAGVIPEAEASPSVTYIEISKSGRSLARNVGIGFSSHPLIIFADDDIFVEPGFVSKHIEVHRPNDRLVVKGIVIHTRSLDNPFSARWKLKDINSSFLATGNASVLKEYIERAGGFDENYKAYGWEDFDLGIHLEKAGLKSVARKIYGYHYDPKPTSLSPVNIYKKERERGSTAVYLYSNHPLGWVKRFTLIKNRVLRALFHLLGSKNWFLRKRKISSFKGLLRLIIRYKAYFDGVDDGKKDCGSHRGGCNGWNGNE